MNNEYSPLYLSLTMAQISFQCRKSQEVAELKVDTVTVDSLDKTVTMHLGTVELNLEHIPNIL